MYLQQVARALAAEHTVTVLAERIDDGPSYRLDESLCPPPRFDPFDDQGVRVEQLRLSFSERLRTLPLIHQVVPGLRRYAYGRVRLSAASIYAKAAAPVIADAARGSDVVHAWAGDMMAFATTKAARAIGAPSVVTPFAHEGWWGDDPASVAAYRAADRVVALLDTEANLYARLGVGRARVAVCGVCSSGAQTGGAQSLRDRYGIQGPLVLFLGVRRPYKGFSLLLEAAPAVASRHPGAVFAFVGPGDGITGSDRVRVIDAGLVSEAERSAWLEAADLLCLPSSSEILPKSILEAWSVGTPALVADIPTLRELVGTTGGGIAVERTRSAIASAIGDLFADPDRLLRMGEAGRRAWQSRYTVDAVASWHEELYSCLTRLPTVRHRLAHAGA